MPNEPPSRRTWLSEPGVLAGGRDHVDRPAQQGPAEPQGVAAAIDLDIAGVQRVGDLAVAEAVGLVQRHAVLGQQQAAIVVGVADARAADRDAHVPAPLALGVDAGGVAQHVVQGQGLAVDIGLLRDHRDAAGGLRQAPAGGGHDGRVLGIDAGGDDHGIDGGALVGGVGQVGRVGQDGKAEGGAGQQGQAESRRHGGVPKTESMTTRVVGAGP
jgi:hypothetical protein